MPRIVQSYPIQTGPSPNPTPCPAEADGVPGGSITTKHRKHELSLAKLTGNQVPGHGCKDALAAGLRARPVPLRSKEDRAPAEIDLRPQQPDDFRAPSPSKQGRGRASMSRVELTLGVSKATEGRQINPPSGPTSPAAGLPRPSRRARPRSAPPSATRLAGAPGRPADKRRRSECQPGPRQRRRAGALSWPKRGSRLTGREDCASASIAGRWQPVRREAERSLSGAA